MTEVGDAARWAADFVSRVEYRPGWSFSVELVQVMPGDPGRIKMTTELVTDDVDDLTRRTRIYDDQDITTAALARSSDFVARVLWTAIGGIENHERFERLRADGVPLLAPHPDGPWKPRSHL